MADQALTPQQAYDVLFGHVHLPVFFEKLAQDYGIVPENETEAQQLLEIGSKLRAAHTDELTKSATADNEFLGYANQQLDGSPEQPGYAADGDYDHAVKEVSAQLAQDPTLHHAVLTYQDAVAQTVLDAQ